MYVCKNIQFIPIRKVEVFNNGRTQIIWKKIMGTLEQLSYIHEIKQLKLEVAKLTEDNKRLVELIKILRK